MVAKVQELRQCLRDDYQGGPGYKDPSTLIAIELNTSCPNIKGHPPPSYDFPTLSPLLDILSEALRGDSTLTIGLKLPPYLFSAQFSQVVQVLTSYTQQSSQIESPCLLNPFAFLTCTNTLGSSLLFSEQVLPPQQNGFALPHGFGGLAGEAIHALSLGNVHAISTHLASSSDPSLQSIVVIGVGGVIDKDAAHRMFKAGAQVVGCATLIGRLGVNALKIL